MKITIIYGQNHKGSTYHMARMLADKIDGEITEFFLPKDFSSDCVRCINCIIKSEELCPHRQELLLILQSMDEADLIVLASPVYVLHATGSMKTFLDHCAYRFMVHRPVASMFHKQAVVLSTAAGGGMKSTNKDMADSTFSWGIAKTYQYGEKLYASCWEEVSDKKKKKIDQKLTKIARQIQKNAGKVRPSLKTKMCFYLMRFMQIRGLNEKDLTYWQANGWTKKVRPWKV